MKPRTRTVLISAAVLVVCVAVLAWAAFAWAKGLERAAYAGRDQAVAGARSLESGDAASAGPQFRAAAASFSEAAGLLDEPWVPAAVAVSPYWHRQYAAARTLVSVGVDGADAGVEIAAAFAVPTTSSTGTTQTRLSAVLTAGRPHVDKAVTLVTRAAASAAALATSGLDPRLASAADLLTTGLRQVRPFIGRATEVVDLAAYLMSAPRRILVISQDNAELRPTGGFAGSFGVLDVGPQGFSLETYADVYTLPVPKKWVTMPPGATMTRNFTFRDANWWIDFPTSARAMLSFWTKYRQTPVDAIVAIDVVTVRDMLAALGPVDVPGYPESFTADNLLQRLLYLVEVKAANQEGRKNVLVALAKVLESRISAAGQGELAGTALALAGSADAKHIQMYFTDPPAEAAVTRAGWSGSMAPPAGTTDLLAVSNAMVVPAKTNVVTSKTVDYSVALRADGSADTTLVLGYVNHAPADFVVSTSVFGDYVRVYRSPGTTMAAGPSGEASGSGMTVDIGLPAVARGFQLLRGMTHVETIETLVPGAWRTGAAPASPGSDVPTGSVPPAGVAHYRLFVVRQADLEDVPTVISVTAPAGWRVTSVVAWAAASGATVPATENGSAARLSVPLATDLVLDVGLKAAS